MARFSRLSTIQTMGEQGVIPVYYNPDPSTMKSVLKACYEGGIRSFEFTNRGDFAHEVFGELVKWAAKELPEMILGTGSVIDAPTAALYMQLGSNFIVSPILKEEMALVCNRRKVPWMPGCGSATEISRAEELGAEVVKIFPGSSVGGPKFVKAFLGPSPWSSIMPTGDVEPTHENLSAWFNAGVYCVGMGSKLISGDIIREGNYDKLRERSAFALDLVTKIRNNKT